jgi:hypothetical protein
MLNPKFLMGIVLPCFCFLGGRGLGRGAMPSSSRVSVVAGMLILREKMGHRRESVRHLFIADCNRAE